MCVGSQQRGGARGGEGPETPRPAELKGHLAEQGETMAPLPQGGQWPRPPAAVSCLSPLTSLPVCAAQLAREPPPAAPSAGLALCVEGTSVQQAWPRALGSTGRQKRVKLRGMPCLAQRSGQAARRWGWCRPRRQALLCHLSWPPTLSGPLLGVRNQVRPQPQLPRSTSNSGNICCVEAE